MNKLSPMLNTFPKIVATPAKEPYYQAKKYDASEPKNQPVEKTDPLDDQDHDEDKVDRKFSDLVAEQEVNEANPTAKTPTETLDTAETEVDATPVDAAAVDVVPTEGAQADAMPNDTAQAIAVSTDSEPTDAAPTETTMLAGELADIKLNELNLNQTDDAQTEAPIVAQGLVETTDTPEQIAAVTSVPLAPENISNDNENIKVAVTPDTAAKAMAAQPVIGEKNPQNLAENLENLSAEDLKKLNLTPEQATKTQSQTKNLLAEANGSAVNPKAEKALSELDASLGQTQNQLDKNSPELAAVKQIKMPQATATQETGKPELTTDKAMDAAQQTAAT